MRGEQHGPADQGGAPARMVPSAWPRASARDSVEHRVLAAAAPVHQVREQQLGVDLDDAETGVLTQRRAPVTRRRPLAARVGGGVRRAPTCPPIRGSSGRRPARMSGQRR